MEKQDLRKGQKVGLGCAVILLSALLYAICSFLTKRLETQGVHFSQVLFFTFFTSWLALFPTVIGKEKGFLKTDRFSWHLLRSICGMTSLCLFVLSLKSISLVNAVMLNNAAPIFIPFVGFFLLKHPINHRLWFAIALGLIGIALILKPSSHVLNIGGVLGTLSAVMMALSWTATSKLTRTEPLPRILFYFFTIASLITAIPLALTWQTIPADQWFWLIGVGLCYFFTIWTFSAAAKLMRMTIVSILYYSVIVFSLLIAWFFYRQLPDLISFIGIVCVTGGGILSIYFEKGK